MPTLHELQRRIGAAVVAGRAEAASRAEAAAAAIVDDAPGAAARLAIYANHFRVTLIDALAASFPVVRRLVGADFFAMAARGFISATPPEEPCLFAYGAGFPAFLAALPAARDLPWLGDVARLEWAIQAAWHAADATAVTAEDLQRMAEGAADAMVALHPSSCLVVSAFPVDQIWQAHQACCDDITPVDLDAGGVSLLVHRRDDDVVGWLRLNAADASFLGALLAGHGLAEAGRAAMADDGAFEAAPLLAALLGAGLIVSLTALPLTDWRANQ